MLSVVYAAVAIKPIILGAIVLNGVMLSVMASWVCHLGQIL
jgi:hypothetical protein